MGNISTYGELQTAVADWLNKSNLTSYIPQFIAIGESDIARKLRCRYNEKRVTASISTEYFDIPSDFLEMRNFSLNTDPRRHLNYESPEQVDLLFASQSTGTPQIYSIHGTEFQVKPVPDTTYTAELTYWYKLTAFSATSDSNTLLTTHPDIYLYASLLAAQPFLIDDSRIQLWNSLYEGALKELNDATQTGQFSGTTLFAKPRTLPEYGINGK